MAISYSIDLIFITIIIKLRLQQICVLIENVEVVLNASHNCNSNCAQILNYLRATLSLSIVSSQQGIHMYKLQVHECICPYLNTIELFRVCTYVHIITDFKLLGALKALKHLQVKYTTFQ